MSLQAGDVVWVPFPYVEASTLKARPAIVLNPQPLAFEYPLFWGAMVTSGNTAEWPGDVVVTDLQLAGLPIPSLVRSAKLATLEYAVARRIGRLTSADFSSVMHFLRTSLP